MKNMKVLWIASLLFFVSLKNTFSQSWVNAVDRHGREVYMPADKYKWDWGQATFLNALIHLYNSSSGPAKKIYLDYIQKAMDATYSVANGKHPNAVASAHGMAFLARITCEKKYLDKSNEIYQDYLKIPRAANGGVSHRAETVELWDDTVYMLNMFLLEMYRLTGDEKYIADFVQQFTAHNEKLENPKSGLWVHGWDADNINYDDGCSIMGWPDSLTRKSSQVWARGNGWVGMALSDALNTIAKSSKYRPLLLKAFKHYVEAIVPLQNKASGHWYQLVTLPAEPKNFLESSCTAMFAYTVTMGLKMKILDKKKYGSLVDQSYIGLMNQSLRDAGDGYMVPTRVSGGTCVGDENYYLGRKIGEGTGFGYGSFIMFGLAYEQYKGLRK
ncbi:MAG: glycosyl hydrolase family 88 [Ferruginibacter sp.]|nr:glycosyl hydrolase family 88 [Ferruginibacter sp.]